MKEVIINYLKGDKTIQEFLDVLGTDKDKKYDIFDMLIIFNYAYTNTYKLSIKKVHSILPKLDKLKEKMLEKLNEKEYIKKTRDVTLKYKQLFNYELYNILFDEYNANEILDEIERINSKPEFIYIINNFNQISNILSLHNSDKNKYQNYLIIAYLYDMLD